MKRIITIFIIVVFCLPLAAQDFIKVTGVVENVSGDPISGVTVYAVGTRITAQTDSKGYFELMIPSTVRYVRAQKSMYVPKNVAVRSSIKIVLERDHEAVEKASAEKAATAEKTRMAAERVRAEEQARTRAAEAARAQAISDSLALVEKVRLEQEARFRAEVEAREIVIRDSLLLAEITRHEAEARAFEEAGRQAVRDSLAAVEARALFVRDSIAAAEAKAIFVSDSIAIALEQQKRDARKAAEDKYNSRFKNHGIESTIEFGYVYQLAKGEIRYLYSGYRQISSMHPLFVDYTCSYRFNRSFSMGIGVGYIYNLKSIVIINDQILGMDDGWNEKRFDLPVFLAIKTRFGRYSVRPIIDCKGGWYPITNTIFMDAGLGVEFRLSKGTALNLTASLRSTPLINIDYNVNHSESKYYPCWSPCARIGFAF